MADDKTKRGPQDRKLISMTEDYEVRYWTEKFGITKEQLAAAVKSVGHSAAAVERHLATSDQPNEASAKAAAKMRALGEMPAAIGLRIAFGVSMKAVPILALLVLMGCEPPPRAATGTQEQQARDAEHSAIRQERAQQEYWEWERGSGPRSAVGGR